MPAAYSRSAASPPHANYRIPSSSQPIRLCGMRNSHWHNVCFGMASGVHPCTEAVLTSDHVC